MENQPRKRLAKNIIVVRISSANLVAAAGIAGQSQLIVGQIVGQNRAVAGTASHQTTGPVGASPVAGASPVKAGIAGQSPLKNRLGILLHFRQ